jgi:hypothetical protein
MKNTLEIQLRALRSPRVLKSIDGGGPELVDVWAFHRGDHSPRTWAIAVKFGRELVEAAMTIDTGTLFTVKGRLDQSKNPATGNYHTFIWAEQISEVVPPARGRSTSTTPDLPNFPDAEAGDKDPQPKKNHA